MIYFDSSALVKRYLEEIGSATVNKIINDSPVIATAKLTYPEILSAFARKFKAGDFSKTVFHKLLDKFENEWNYFLVIEFKDELFQIIKHIAANHRLKAADSVHLASALWLKQSIKEDIIFAASDIVLLKSAKTEKLSIINPQEN